MEYNPVISDPNIRDNEYPASMMSFLCNSNNERLIGTVFLAQGKEKKPLLLLLPGFPGNEINFDIAHASRRAGWNVLVFNYRGSWGSSGKYLFSNSLEDIDAVLSYVRSEEFSEKFNTDSTKIAVAGHSMGGFAAIKKAAKYEYLNNIAAFASFNFGYVGKLFNIVPGAKEIALEKLSMGAMVLSASGEELFEDIIKHASEWDLVDISPNLNNKNLLLIGAKHDHLAPAEMHHTPLVSAFKKMV